MVKEDMVFIIDDDVILNEIQSLLIHKLYPDILINTFTGANDAIQAIDNQIVPDTIFLDLHIPGDSETLFLDEHKIRQLESDIYIMSSMPYLDNQKLISGYAAVRDFISKPLLEYKIRQAFNHYA